jgi:hypothetical protein
VGPCCGSGRIPGGRRPPPSHPSIPELRAFSRCCPVAPSGELPGRRLAAAASFPLRTAGALGRTPGEPARSARLPRGGVRASSRRKHGRSASGSTSRNAWSRPAVDTLVLLLEVYLLLLEDYHLLAVLLLFSDLGKYHIVDTLALILESYHMLADLLLFSDLGKYHMLADLIAKSVIGRVVGAVLPHAHGPPIASSTWRSTTFSRASSRSRSSAGS